MRCAIYCLLAGALVLLAGGKNGFAADGNKAAKGEHSHATATQAQEMIQKFDTNGDGKLDAKELAAAIEQRQEQHGEEHHGQTQKVTKATKAAKSSAAGSPQARADELIQRFDTNGDHKLDAAELQAMLAAAQALKKEVHK